MNTNEGYVDLRRTVIATAIAVGLSGCAGKERPQPIIKTVEVKVPVKVPCEPKVGARPAYGDSDAELKAAPDILERVKILLVGRERRTARESVLEAAVAECGGSLDAR